MHIVEIHQAQKQLAQLIAEAAAGDRVVLADDGKPVAVIAAYTGESTFRSKGLPLWSGHVTGSLSRQSIYEGGDA